MRRRSFAAASSTMAFAARSADSATQSDDSACDFIASTSRAFSFSLGFSSLSVPLSLFFVGLISLAALSIFWVSWNESMRSLPTSLTNMENGGGAGEEEKVEIAGAAKPADGADDADDEDDADDAARACAAAAAALLSLLYLSKASFRREARIAGRCGIANSTSSVTSS